MSSERPSGDRTLTWWPIAGAAVIAAIGIAIIVFVGGGSQNRVGLVTDDNNALKCEPTYLQNSLETSTVPRAWVPVKGNGAGVDGTAALVPDKKTVQISICHYAAPGTSAQARPKLLGRVTLTKGLKEMTKQLTAYPAATATSAAGTCTKPGDYYLVGFVFSDGTAIWVAVPDDGCQKVTNGDFEVDAQIRTQVQSAYLTRAWS